MPFSTAAKAALCLCPPAVMAGAVATVPRVKQAIHHLTADHRLHKPVHRLATAVAHPAVGTARRAGCDPVAPGLEPAVPLVTYAAPIPAEPVSHEAISGPASSGIGGAPAVVALGVVAPVSPVTGMPTQAVPPTTSVSAIPEPTSWILLIVGAGFVGGVLRRRRGSRRMVVRTASGTMLWGAGTVAVEAGDVATTVVAKSVVASTAGKALMCVCPAALVAGSVIAVPPLRQAVHSLTAAPVSLPAPVIGAAVPCGQSMTVSAAGVNDLPAVVSTATGPS